MRIWLRRSCSPVVLAAMLSAMFCVSSLAMSRAQQPTSAVAASTRVSSTSTSIQLPSATLTRRETEYDARTGVWSVFFDPAETMSGAGDYNLILNFYGWKPPTSAQDVAQRFAAKFGPDVLFEFQAPDAITQTPAFYLVYQDVRESNSFGYAYISKVGTVDGGAYAVTLSRRIGGRTRDEIGRNIRAWLLSQEGKALTRATGAISVDATWRDTLKQQ